MMLMMTLPALYLPRDVADVRRERADAILDFAAAPLLWMWLPAVLLVTDHAICETYEYAWQPFDGKRPLLWTGAVFGAISLLLLLRSFTTLIQQAGNPSVSRGWLAFFTLPILWTMMAGILAWSVPSAILFIAIFFRRFI